jgi:hypothetical protein
MKDERDDALMHCPMFVRKQILLYLYRTQMLDLYLFEGCTANFVDGLVCEVRRCLETDTWGVSDVGCWTQPLRCSREKYSRE